MNTSPRELLLLRHGIAEERAAGLPDAGRRLTKIGRERTTAVLERAVAMGLGAERMASSPLVRARETAELAVAAGLAPSMAVEECLAPGVDPLPLLKGWSTTGTPGEGTSKEGACGRLVLVGHEPDLSLLACHLIGARPGALRLKKAGLALLRFLEPPQRPRAQAVEMTPGCAALQLLIGPGFLLR